MKISTTVALLSGRAIVSNEEISSVSLASQNMVALLETLPRGSAQGKIGTEHHIARQCDEKETISSYGLKTCCALEGLGSRPASDSSGSCRAALAMPLQDEGRTQQATWEGYRASLCLIDVHSRVHLSSSACLCRVRLNCMRQSVRLCLLH